MRRWEWLAEVVNKNHYQKGAELGVKEGQTLDYLLTHCNELIMLGVDIWEPTPGYQDWNHVKHEAKAREIERRHNPALTLWKMTTTAAAHEVEDGSLDFVFIDADHSIKAVLSDIAAWSPKVRKGGMIAGHDIGQSSVRKAVEQMIPDYKQAGHDHCWYIFK